MTTYASPRAEAAPFGGASLSIDYPDRPLDRWSSALRILWAIPILIVMAALSRGAGPAGGLLFLPPLVMLVGRGRYPAWWYRWNVEMLRFGTRVAAYLALMDDRYPSTDEEQGVHVTLADPGDAKHLSRSLPLVKWALALPHYVVLAVLAAGAVLAVIAAWFSIVLTGQYPRVLFAYVEGVLRWWTRVAAYAFLLVTDEYPPFRLGV